MVRAMLLASAWIAVVSLNMSKVQAQEEDEIPGLPVGESAKLPDRIDWTITKESVFAKTISRSRLRIEGLWRFAPVLKKTDPVKRPEMGWIEMPSGSWQGKAKVYDTADKFTDGVWGDAKLDSFPFAWAERDVKSRATWLRKRVFLMIKGPWQHSEVFSFFEKVPAEKRASLSAFELTEVLAYPGTTQLSLRAAAKSFEDGPGGAPNNLWIELVPIGPRIDDIECFRDGDNLVADFLVYRPPVFLIQGLSLKRIPMTLKIRVRDSESNEVVLSRWADIGKLPDVRRRVRVPLGKIAKSGKLQISSDLCPTEKDVFDVTFPVKFDASMLAPPPKREKIDLVESKEPAE